MAITNGIFAALFVCLLIYELKDSRAREKKYQKTIESLSVHLSTVEDIQEDVIEIKDMVLKNTKKKVKDEESNKTKNQAI